MTKTGWVRVVLTIALLGWVNQGWADDGPAAPSHHSTSQPSSGSDFKITGGGVGHGKVGMMGGKHKGMPGMIQGKKYQGLGMHDGMGRQGMAGAHEMRGMPGMMAPFHGWMNRLMANRQAVGLTPEQLEQIDLALAEHRKFALRSQAEAAALRIDLTREIRKHVLDLNSVETLVKSIGEQETKTEMEGIRLYASVLNMFTPEQRAKVDELVGTPFPRPWERTVRPDEAEQEGHDAEGANPSESPTGEKAQLSVSGGGGGCR